MSLLQDLLLLPITLAISFGTMATFLIAARPEVVDMIRSRWVNEGSQPLGELSFHVLKGCFKAAFDRKRPSKEG